MVYAKGCKNGMSKGFGRVGIMQSSGNPNTLWSCVANDLSYDSTNDAYYENTSASTWAQIS